ncbi:MAG: response regulator, partial [Sterolibacterium sp.]
MQRLAAREFTIEKLKILVVDDSNTNVLMMKMLLNTMGHDVVTASDGLLGIEAFRQEDPEVILMDVMMPNMDGIESARRIRKISAVVPIIFLSAATDTGLMEQALRLGSDYITKPIQMPQLLDKLNAHFRTILAYREVLAQKKEVEQLHARLVDENTIASHVLTRMLSGFQPPSDILQYTVIPSGMFSGDIVLVGATPSGKLNILLADAI